MDSYSSALSNQQEKKIKECFIELVKYLQEQHIVAIVFGLSIGDYVPSIRVLYIFLNILRRIY